jgi:hypothetical protein
MTICEWDKTVAKMCGVVPQVLEGDRRYSCVWANRDGEKEIIKKKKKKKRKVVRNGKKCL